MDKQEGKYIILSYRSHIIKKIATTYYDSDSGWGCMLRVGQMAIANLLHSYHQMPLSAILPLFWDNSDRPFSIQTITHLTQQLYPHKKQFQWYNPCQMGFIIKRLLEVNVPNICTTIFTDNSIFLSQISTKQPLLLIMIMIRIGLDEPEDIYLPVVQSLMQNQYFFCALGGTPKHAHLFLKCINHRVGYLDPHTTRKAALNENELKENSHQYLSQVSWLKLNKMDSSMGLVFRLQRQQLDSFWMSFEKLKQGFKERFFIYMQRQKPDINDDDLIEITDQDFQ